MRPRRHRSWRERSPGDLVDELLESYGYADEVRAYEVKLAWPDFGVSAPGRSWPDRLDSGTLCVRATSSPQLQDLAFRKDEIARKANRILGKASVVDVHLKLGVWGPEEEADLALWRERRQRAAR